MNNVGYVLNLYRGHNQPHRVSTHSRPATGQHAMTDSPSKSLPISLIDGHVHLAALPDGNKLHDLFAHVEGIRYFGFLFPSFSCPLWGSMDVPTIRQV
jgi:hypothetical protein